MLLREFIFYEKFSKFILKKGKSLYAFNCLLHLVQKQKLTKLNKNVGFYLTFLIKYSFYDFGGFFITKFLKKQKQKINVPIYSFQKGLIFLFVSILKPLQKQKRQKSFLSYLIQEFLNLSLKRIKNLYIKKFQVLCVQKTYFEFPYKTSFKSRLKKKIF